MIVFVQRTKCAIFVNRSTIISIASKFFENGKSVMKSMEQKTKVVLELAVVAEVHTNDVEGSSTWSKCHKITQIL
jgi:hypothetical protein